MILYYNATIWIHSLYTISIIDNNHFITSSNWTLRQWYQAGRRYIKLRFSAGRWFLEFSCWKRRRNKQSLVGIEEFIVFFYTGGYTSMNCPESRYVLLRLRCSEDENHSIFIFFTTVFRGPVYLIISQKPTYNVWHQFKCFNIFWFRTHSVACWAFQSFVHPVQIHALQTGLLKQCSKSCWKLSILFQW